MLINIGIILLLIWIIFDDFKNREVNIFSLMALLIFGFLYHYFQGENIYELIKVGGINSLIISAVFGSTFLYLRKFRRIEKPSETHLGMGDYFFFLALVFFFPPQYYVLLFIGMTFIAMVIGVVMQFIQKHQPIIPYAGIGAFSLLILQVCVYFGYSLEETINQYLGM